MLCWLDFGAIGHWVSLLSRYFFYNLTYIFRRQTHGYILDSYNKLKIVYLQKNESVAIHSHLYVLLNVVVDESDAIFNLINILKYQSGRSICGIILHNIFAFKV